MTQVAEYRAFLCFQVYPVCRQTFPLHVNILKHLLHVPVLESSQVKYSPTLDHLALGILTLFKVATNSKLPLAIRAKLMLTRDGTCGDASVVCNVRF